MTINSALQDWIIGVTGYDDQHVIRAYQNGPRPVGDFATYQLLSAIPFDYALEKQTNLGGGNIDSEFVNMNTLTISINIYAADGMEKLGRLFLSRYKLSTREILEPEKLVLQRKGDIWDLVEPGDTKWRPRFQCDFEFGGQFNLNEANQEIQIYFITGETINDSDVVTEHEIEVGPVP